MTRGTTPDIIATLSGVDFSEITSLYVTIRQGSVIVEKTMDDVILKSPDIHITLSQKETLSFSVNKEAQIQIRGMLNGERAFATNIKKTTIKPILKEGVIE